MSRSVLDRAPMIVIITLAALASLIPLSVGTSATTLFGAIALAIASAIASAIALATAGGTVAATLGCCS